jgi:hypothetical protein
MEGILDGKNFFAKRTKVMESFPPEKSNTGYQIEQSLLCISLRFLKHLFLLSYSLYIYFIRRCQEGKPNGLYSYVLVCYCFLTLYLAAYFDVIRTLCDSTPPSSGSNILIFRIIFCMAQ